jgi:Na+-driven multidrug efflux pump
MRQKWRSTSLERLAAGLRVNIINMKKKSSYILPILLIVCSVLHIYQTTTTFFNGSGDSQFSFIVFMLMWGVPLLFIWISILSIRAQELKKYTSYNIGIFVALAGYAVIAYGMLNFFK